MSGRDFGRGDRGGFRDRDRGDRGGGGFRDRDGGRPGGNFRDRDRGPGGGYGDRGGIRDRGDRGDRSVGGPAGGSRPWEQRDTDRPERPSGSRPFERPERAEPDQAVRVERYYDEEGGRPPREERGDRPQRFGGDRGGDRPAGRGAYGRDAITPPAPRPTPPGAAGTAPARQRDEMVQQEPQPFAASPFVAPRAGEGAWTYHHLSDSWRDEERLRGWTPNDSDLQEMVEDNIEADPQLNGRDRRNIQVRAEKGVVTLTGTVRSRVAKFAAGSDAYWTYGVQEVRNDLAVRVRGPQGNAASQSTAAPATDAAAGGPEASDDAAPAAASAPAKKPKRATRTRAAALDAPAVTETDPTGIDNEGLMPPRTSRAPKDPVEGSIDPTGGAAEVRASETPVDERGAQ